MTTCPHCSAQLNDNARFCRGCGKAIAQPPEPSAASAKRFCPHCGQSISPAAKFCPHCSRQLTPSQMLTPPASNVSAPHISLPATPAPSIAQAPPIAPGGPAGIAPRTGKIPLGTIISNRYVVQKVLGIGGMGAVYLALDNRLNNAVALKEMSDSHLANPVDRQKAGEAFKNEARLLSYLNHPNLPRVTDYFSENNNQFLVMDFVPGQTLAQMLEDRSQPFSEAQVIHWAEQLCDVLHYLHTRQPPVIFRDLKPGNVMVSPDGLTVKLIDFGIVRLFKAGASKDTMSLGTPGYAPPEQFGKAQTDTRSDIYALGALLHHLLTLRDPALEMFKFPSLRSLNTKVSEQVEVAIEKAVQLKPVQRWDSMLSFKSALLVGSPSPGLSERPIAAVPAPAPQPLPAQSVSPRSLPQASPVIPPVAPPDYTPIGNPVPPPSSIFSPVNYSLLDSAGIMARIGAYIVDAFILGLILGAISIFFADSMDSMDGGILYFAITFGLMAGYFSLFHATSGQTPGKSSAHIKVVRMDGSRLGFMRALWRYAMLVSPPLSISLVLGLMDPELAMLPAGLLLFLVPLFNSERRALHDYLSDTRVVKT